MRTILITGPGGSGRTTVAAATALAAAGEGTRTLVLSADRTDTLGAVLGVPTGPAPVQVAENLTAWRPDATAGFRDDLAAFQDRASSVLDLLGASRLDPEEVTPLPGAEELTLLRALRDAALSEAARPARRRPAAHPAGPRRCSPSPRSSAAICAACSRPSARRPAPCAPSSAGSPASPCPREWLYETAARWDVELAAVEAVVADRNTVVRLVAEPGPAGADAVRSRRSRPRPARPAPRRPGRQPGPAGGGRGRLARRARRPAAQDPGGVAGVVRRPGGRPPRP